MSRTAVALRLGFAAAAGMALACHRTPGLLLSVRAEQIDGGTRLTLLGAPGIQINARLKPALELDNGSVVRFDSPALTSDSSYFTAPPAVTLQGESGPVHGHLRASVCPEGENVCRAVELQL